ncbi:MAG TPA: DHH family phosphoesterase [Thermoplasmatales archaeon]|nr:DHH family phosphoesterase [Thermoplasmatales archaeon]
MGIIEKAAELAEIIRRKKDLAVIAHADADGVAGAAISKFFLEKNDIEYELKFVDYLRKELLSEYKGKEVLFIDVGNGNIEEIERNRIEAIIVDHHLASKYFKNSLNPFHYGIDGGEEISASGLMHLITGENAEIALIGAAGDLQDRNGLKGWNRRILMKSGIIAKNDIKLYGRSLPLYRMLSFSPLIPPFFKNVGSVIRFLNELSIDEKKTWNELSMDEKRRLFSSIVKMMIMRGYEKDDIIKLYGEVYELDGIDLREIASGINAMAKYGEYSKAIYVCITGNYERMKEFINTHRKNIKMGIRFAKENLSEGMKIKYFHAGKKIKGSILGTVTGMLLEGEKIEKPVVGMVENEEEIKISARAPKNMNVNLSIAIRNAARATGGHGGGHKMAAGATIPKGYEEEFLRFFELEIANQSSIL